MSSGYPLNISFFRLGSRLCFSAPVSRIDTQIDLVDRSWTRAGGRAKFTEKAVRPVPTSVTSSPSRIHVMPSASTINQCHRLQGSRSMRSATSVSTYSGDTISFSLLAGYFTDISDKGVGFDPLPEPIKSYASGLPSRARERVVGADAGREESCLSLSFDRTCVRRVHRGQKQHHNWNQSSLHSFNQVDSYARVRARLSEWTCGLFQKVLSSPSTDPCFLECA